MKFRGYVGYAVVEDKGYGVYVDTVVEKPYRGDVLRAVSRWAPSVDGINDNLTMSNQISIIADAFAYANFSHIKYVRWGDQCWKVESVDPTKRPRLILTLGGAYFGEKENPLPNAGGNNG